MELITLRNVLSKENIKIQNNATQHHYRGQFICCQSLTK